MVDFTVLKKSSTSRARTGLIETAHGKIETPVFIPVGTRGALTVSLKLT